MGLFILMTAFGIMVTALTRDPAYVIIGTVVGAVLFLTKKEGDGP